MDRDAADRLLARLDGIAAALVRRPDALGLLALGSVGAQRARIDAGSDLDFFVVVRAGAKAATIAHLDWLAEPHPVAWSFRNTADGCKALYADGVLAEFAVFEPGELACIPYAPGRFVFRRDELPAALEQPARPLPQPPSRDWLVGEILTNLIVGLQREARGEHLAATRMVQVHALDRLLELLELDRTGGEAAPLRDPFAVDRRVERRLADETDLLRRAAPGYGRSAEAAAEIVARLRRQLDPPAAPLAQIDRLLAAAAIGQAPDAARR